MEQDRDLEDYRACLIDGLKVSARRSACSSSDPIHVFVNEHRVGALDGGGNETTFQLQLQTRIDTVQLRSEDGVLLGGLAAPEYGFRTAHIPISGDTVQLRVHNTAQGGSATAMFTPAPSSWRRIWKTLTGSAGAAVRRPMVTVAPGFRVVAATQLLLAIVVLGLAADRIAVWMAPERTPSLVTQAEAPWAASLPEVTKLERQLGELAQMQARTVDTIQSQHEGMAQLQSAITRLSSTQEKVVSNMLTVRQEMEKQQKGSGREVRQMTRLLMGKALSEQEQLEAEIHSLRVANDRLSQKMVGLEQDNEELKKKLKATGVEVSKAVVSGNGNATTTRPPDILQTPQSLQAADSRSNIQLQPFLFWVAFSEGVTQESIDQWLREMDGHKGVLNEGWQEVQIVQPAVPPDRFLDRIREAKIVKAVRTSR
ncbi:MAG: hypothetical protein K2X00_06270 [Nitrospiraceae bacterium]|jgi:hypothetical protein|uniref:hypothetical protein n=1 Tax=Nitrospira cf. moscoviensis SBR1015 TaxID=96242 RepID=UPI000A0AFA81|nr:hypothetical protein [Nitrospira cf. moscoviensis SBR1015]MBX9658154.1 hypothetical protein [Nitrospiraceae bacterium]OQW29997.1 MAG: hypothetical protein A4E20_04615 [Nitrospira sp. SG-bin2]